MTTLNQGPDRDVLHQYAVSFPHLVNSQTVIEEARLQPQCELRRCVVSVADQPVHLILMSELRSGFNMIMLPPRQLPLAPGDADPDTEHAQDVSFLQRAHLLGATPRISAFPLSPLVESPPIRQQDDERQTHGLVAQTHGPSILPVRLQLQDLIPEDRVESTCGTAVRLRSVSTEFQVPMAVEVSWAHSEDEVAHVLRDWRIDCQVFKFGGHDEYLCVPFDWDDPGRHVMYCTDEGEDAQAVVLHTWRTQDGEMSSYAHMKVLHQLGFLKTAIVRTDLPCDSIHRVVFAHLQPELEGPDKDPRLPTPWPYQTEPTNPF